MVISWWITQVILSFTFFSCCLLNSTGYVACVNAVLHIPMFANTSGAITISIPRFYSSMIIKSPNWKNCRTPHTTGPKPHQIKNVIQKTWAQDLKPKPQPQWVQNIGMKLKNNIGKNLAWGEYFRLVFDDTIMKYVKASAHVSVSNSLYFCFSIKTTLII